MNGSQVLREMAEQPEVLGRIADRRAEIHQQVRAALRRPPVAVRLIARGSSDNVAIHARYLLELATGLPVSLVAPSLITRYGQRPDARDHLVVALSQSGRTPEIVDVVNRLSATGAMVVAITNDDRSPLAEAAAITLSVRTSDELAVPATKTVTGQLALVTALAEAVGESISTHTGGEEAWRALSDVVGRVVAREDGVEDAVALLLAWPTAVHLARGLTYAAALEGALKCKETTRRVHEGLSSADFLHGPLTVSAPGLPVVAYAAAGPVLDDVAQTTRAAADLGSSVVGVGDPRVCRDISGAVAIGIPPGLGEALAVIPLVIRGQQLAIRTTLAMGLDPDAPAGLNKVTATH